MLTLPLFMWGFLCLPYPTLCQTTVLKHANRGGGDPNFGHGKEHTENVNHCWCAFLTSQLWQSRQNGQSLPIKHRMQKFAIVGDCDLKSFTVGENDDFR